MTLLKNEAINRLSKWRSIELLGYYYYSKQGYRIFVQLIGNSHYDFVIEKDNMFKRVNVKVASLRKKTEHNSWSISLPGSYKQKEKSDRTPFTDIFLVWLPNINNFIELPGSFFDGYCGKTVKIPKEILKKVGAYREKVYKKL